MEKQTIAYGKTDDSLWKNKVNADLFKICKNVQNYIV